MIEVEGTSDRARRRQRYRRRRAIRRVAPTIATVLACLALGVLIAGVH